MTATNVNICVDGELEARAQSVLSAQFYGCAPDKIVYAPH